MTSKSLFLARCRENNKRRIWVWIVSILIQLISYPAVVTIYLSRIHFNMEEGIYKTTALYRKELYQAAADAVGFQPKLMFVIITLAMITGIQGFSYLHDRKKVDLYHSVPVSMKSRYFAIYWNGIGIYLLPNLISIVVAVLIAATQGAVNDMVLIKCILAFFTNLLYFLFLYHTAILAIMITGNTLITGFMIIGILGMEWLAVQIYNSMKFSFYEKADSFFSDVEPMLSPILDYDSSVYDLKYSLDLSEMMQILLPLYVKWIIMAGIIGILAYVCYKKRSAGMVGKAIVFEKLRTVLKVIVAVYVGMTSCCIIYESTYYNVWITVLAIIAVTVLCCGAMEVVFEADIRAFIKHPVSGGVALGIVLVLFGIYNFDIFGYDTYIPQAEKVESFAINNNSIYYGEYYEEEEYISSSQYFKENMFLTQTEAVCALAKKNNSMQLKEMEDGRTFSVLYRMKSGREVARKIFVDFADETNEEYLNQLFGSREYWGCVYQLADENYEVNLSSMDVEYNNGTRVQAVPIAAEGKIREAWIKDMENYDFSLVRHNRICGEISYFDSRYYSNFTLPVYESFTNTIAGLKEVGAYYPLSLQAEDILNISITNYHSDLYEEMEGDIATLSSDSYGAAESVVRETGGGVEATQVLYENPEEIAEIIKHIYPNNLDNNSHSADAQDSNYEVAIAFKSEKDYSYGIGYHYYQFLRGEVPSFVIEDTAIPGL